MLAIIENISNKKDKSKMEHIFEEYYSLMLYIATGILKNRAMAEDAVSDSIEKIIRNISNIGDVSCYKTKAYIVIIVKNTSINLLKKEMRGASLGDDLLEIMDSDSLTPEKLVSIEGYKNLVEIIMSLSPTLKDIAILSLVHGYSHSEIATELGLSYDVVKMRLSRARREIKNILGGGQHGE